MRNESKLLKAEAEEIVKKAKIQPQTLAPPPQAQVVPNEELESLRVIILLCLAMNFNFTKH